jgi:DNA-binding transcriptional regulator YhcF (GntR family)
MYQFKPAVNGAQTKVQQIVYTIIMDIEKGVLEKNAQLPSINDFSRQYAVARDTVEKSYRLLKKEGYIASVASKGYFVLGKKDTKLRILFVFNKVSSYKKNIFESFIQTLGDRARVDIQVFHYNPKLFKEIIENNLGRYHYYVIMPHFFHHTRKEEYLSVIRQIPKEALVVLDKGLQELKENHITVYQDFKQDIYDTFSSALDLFEKYKRLCIIFPTHSNHPLEIVEGTSHFCVRQQKLLSVIDTVEREELQAGTAYIVISESDLAKLLKKIKSSGMVLGKDIGVISFNETELKDLLDITVITTDFEEMGRTAANLVLSKKAVQLRNPFKMIRRHSL